MDSKDETASPSSGAPLSLDLDRVGTVAGAPVAVTCLACKQSVGEQYFEIGGKTTCQRCKEAIEAQFQGGSRVSRGLRATALGSLAGALGAGAYYAAVKVTGYEIGLVAVVLGFVVGRAVRRGSRARGGWFYQGLAIGLTYLSISAAHAPFVVQGLRAAFEKEEVEVLGTKLPEAATPNSADPATSNEPTDADRAPTASPPAPLGGSSSGETGIAAAPVPKPDPQPRATRWAEQHPVLGVFAFAAGILALAMVAPFLSIREGQGVIGLFIIGFALYEAWRMNRRVVLQFTGPYRVGTASGGGGDRSAPTGSPLSV